MLPLRFSSPYPFTNTLQIFESNSAFGALCNENKFFRNLMIDVGGKPALFDSTLAQESFGRSGATSLQFAAQPAVTRARTVDLVTGESCAVARLSDCHHTQVNTDKVKTLGRFGYGSINGHVQKPFTVAVDRIGFAAVKVQERSVLVTATKICFPETKLLLQLGAMIVH